jgi:hypothetical protein
MLFLKRLLRNVFFKDRRSKQPIEFVCTVLSTGQPTQYTHTFPSDACELRHKMCWLPIVCVVIFIKMLDYLCLREMEPVLIMYAGFFPHSCRRAQSYIVCWKKNREECSCPTAVWGFQLLTPLKALPSVRRDQPQLLQVCVIATCVAMLSCRSR